MVETRTPYSGLLILGPKEQRAGKLVCNTYVGHEDCELVLRSPHVSPGGY